MSEWAWQLRAICSLCGFHVGAPEGSLLALDITICPGCGAPGPTTATPLHGESGWSVRPMRYMEGRIWWKPWTWRREDGWEVLEGAEEEVPT